MKVIIIGGGVVGMLTALALQDRHHEVLVFDQPTQRPPASWAGGGILSALFPWRYPAALTHLTSDALSRYQGIAKRIIASGASDPEVQQQGMLVLGEDDTVRAQEWANRYGVSLAMPQARHIEQVPQADNGVWLPDIGSIRNPRLLKGLKHLLSQSGVSLCFQSVKDVICRNDQWCVTTDSNDFKADKVLIAAGAWSAPLLTALGCHLPLMPVQGEMMRFVPAKATLNTIVLSSQGYVIPRRDGSYLVGSTLRADSYDQRPTEAGERQLRQIADQLWPALRDEQPVAHWAGVRPGSAQSWPWLGEVPGQPGLFVATGHFRNGLVAAPASATLIAQLICNETPFIDPAPYALPSSSNASFFSR